MQWSNRYFLVLILYSLLGFSQKDKKLDSLISVYTKAELDTDRINKYADIGAYVASKGNRKEGITYYQKIIQTFSKSYPQKCIDAKNKIALNYVFMEEYDKADSLANQIIEESTKLNYPIGIGMAYRNLGLANTYKGNFKEAITYHLKVLKIWEETKNTKMICMSNSDLGIVFYYQGNNEKAAFYWEISLKNNPDKESDDYISNCSNLGQAYVSLSKYDKASECFKKALLHYANNKKSDKYTNALTGMANIEYLRKNYQQAITYYTEIIKLREESNARNNDIAASYLNISGIYAEFGKPKEALDYGLKGYQKALESEDKHELLHAYENMNIVYAKNNNFEKAYEFSQLYDNLKDSLNNIESQKQVNELDKQYQTEKKEKDNQLLSKQLEIQQIQGRQQKMFLIISGVVLVLIAMLAIVFFNQNKQKHRANLKLEAKNKIIEEQKILVDKAYIELHEKNKEVVDSIHYAKRIQTALITSEKYIERSLSKLMENK